MTDGVDEMRLGDAALWYAARGLPVFPCQPRGKAPLISGGFTAATTDAATIERWWLKWPDANIGIPTGARSGLLAVDVDPRNGGDESLETITADTGQLPQTAEALTGGGGRHIIFAHEPGLRCHSIAPGIDLKTDGGYIIVAPSVHPSGQRYSWDGVDGADSLDHLAPLPSALRALAARGDESRAHDSATDADATPILDGARNTTLTRLAGVMRRRGMSHAAILAALAAENQSRCQPPLAGEEVERIAGSIARYEPAEQVVPITTRSGKVRPSARGGKPAAQTATAADGEDASWRARLLLNLNGTVKPVLANAITALREAPEWAGVLAYNEFAHCTTLRKPAPGMKPKVEVPADWTSNHDILTTEWLHHQGIFVSADVAGQAVEAVAREWPFHPVLAYLQDLTWDGRRRLESWLMDYLGVTHSPYTAAVGSRWMISAVARVFEPACKADCCLILEGEQGIGKSTALRVLAQPWFTDEIADIGSKDAALQTRGVWVIEIAELDSMSRSEVGKIKAFMSRMTDHFRPPYGRRPIDSPRQCVFAGSVNHGTYLRDETGGRRFWPVECKAPVIDVDALADVRDQLWAEATCLYFDGKPWWLDSVALNRESAKEQADRYEGDPWDDLILEWAGLRDSVSIVEVLTSCLQKQKDMWTQWDRIRVARCLRANGWKQYRARSGSSRAWRYRQQE